MREFRKQGKHNAPGETRAEIFNFLLDFPDGVNEDAVREYIYYTLSIRDSRSVRNQLEKLKEESKIFQESGVWKVYPFDRDSFWEFWTKLDFETKLRLISKGVIQNHIEDIIYPEFVNQVEYDPAGFSHRLSRLKLGGDFRVSYDFHRPLLKQEEEIIRTAFRTMPTMVDFQLALRPEVDVMAFDLVGHLVRLHPEKEGQYFTPGHFGLLYVLIARYFFGHDITQSEILPEQVIRDCDFWMCVPFMEKFHGLVAESDLDEIGDILRTVGEFSARLADRDSNAWQEGQVQEIRSTAGEKWVMLARDWPGRGFAPCFQEGAPSGWSN